MKDLWGSLGVLVQWHYNEACHFEENPTVSEAHFPASVLGCSNRFSYVKDFAVLSSGNKKNWMKGWFVTSPEHILGQDQAFKPFKWSTFQTNHDNINIYVVLFDSFSYLFSACDCTVLIWLADA